MNQETLEDVLKEIDKFLKGEVNDEEAKQNLKNSLKELCNEIQTDLSNAIKPMIIGQTSTLDVIEGVHPYIFEISEKHYQGYSIHPGGAGISFSPKGNVLPVRLRFGIIIVAEVPNKAIVCGNIAIDDSRKEKTVLDVLMDESTNVNPISTNIEKEVTKIIMTMKDQLPNAFKKYKETLIG